MLDERTGRSRINHGLAGTAVTTSLFGHRAVTLEGVQNDGINQCGEYQTRRLILRRAWM